MVFFTCFNVPCLHVSSIWLALVQIKFVLSCERFPLYNRWKVIDGLNSQEVNVEHLYSRCCNVIYAKSYVVLWHRSLFLSLFFFFFFTSNIQSPTECRGDKHVLSCQKRNHRGQPLSQPPAEMYKRTFHLLRIIWVRGRTGGFGRLTNQPHRWQQDRGVPRPARWLTVRPGIAYFNSSIDTHVQRHTQAKPAHTSPAVLVISFWSHMFPLPFPAHPQLTPKQGHFQQHAIEFNQSNLGLTAPRRFHCRLWPLMSVTGDEKRERQKATLLIYRDIK